MRKVLFTIIGLLSYFELFAQFGYRCDGKYIELTPCVSGRYYVQTKNPESRNYLEQIQNADLRHNSRKSEVYMISDNSFFVSSKSILNLSEKDYISEEFNDLNGNPIFVLPRIILALKDNAPIKDMINGYAGILTLDSIQRFKGMYTLTCSLPTARDVLKVVADLDSYDEVEWCEPDMIFNWKAHDYNPLFSSQYYLQNNNSGHYDINVVPAWEIITGSSNITVAVIDEGVDSDHEDLIGNVLQGYTIGDATGYGKPKNANEFNRKSHGVACAGIIGAKNNDKGILGVANGVNILPVNIAPYAASGYYLNGTKIVVDEGWTACNSDLAYAIQWASEHAEILSCSWGSDSECNAIINVINNARTNGRNGKGCIIVASSGNDYYNGLTTIKFPARMDGVIAVGAIDRYGNIQSYSQRGSALDLVAPSGLCNFQGDVVTTDRADNLGYNPYAVPSGSDLANKNYTQLFGGTSAACPQVAGVAALMLSANPNLTASQLRIKLRNTARDLGPIGFDTTHGYGLVNAYAAVCSALSGDDIVGPALVNTNGQFDIVNLPSGVSVSWSLSNNYYNNGYNLVPNYPTVGHCRINRNPNHDLLNDTLTAQIKYNNVTVQTLRKSGIYAYAGFRGRYTSAVGSGNLDGVYPFPVKPNWTYYLTSPNFYGATVTYNSGGATPSIWGFSPTYGDLTFVTTNTSTPVLIDVDDVFGNHYQLIALPDNTPATSISISNGESGITVTLNEDGSSERGLSLDQPWTIEIRNATTGQLMTTQSSTNRSIAISTSGWSKGIYIVKVTVGKEILTEKVVVK